MQVSGVTSGYSFAAAAGMSGMRMGGVQGPPPPPPGANTAFSDVDTDGDGSISQTELESLLSQNDTAATSTDNRAADLFKKIDTDGDGQISSSEWSTFQEKVKQGPLPPPPSDTSSSDAISSVLKSLVSQLYKSADTNSDGQLSQDEMTGWLNQQSSGSTTGTTSINYAV